MPPAHPNATASLITTGLAYLIYRITSHYDWLSISPSNTLLIAGAIITGVLYVGRRGLWPTLKAVWFGAQKAATGQPDSAPPVEPPPPAA